MLNENTRGTQGDSGGAAAPLGLSGDTATTDRILILDFGSQVTQLIARRVRESGVYCELHPHDVDDAFVRSFNPRGVILSGSHASVTQEETARAPQAVFELGVPVLGICYGMQTMAAQLGGKVEPGKVREFGFAEVRARGHTRLLDGIDDYAAPDAQVLHTDQSFTVSVWVAPICRS